MKLFKLMVVALWAAVMFVSCDTRDDLYYDDVRRGQYIIEVNGVRDTVIGYYNNSKGSVTCKLHPKSLGPKYYSLILDTLYIKASILVRGVEYPLRFTNQLFRDPDDLSGLLRIAKNHVVVWETLSDEYTMRISTKLMLEEDILFFWEDTVGHYFGHDVIGLGHEAFYGEHFPDQLTGEYEDDHQVFMVNILLDFFGPCPPTPKLDVIDVEGNPFEKILSMANSFDKDGEVMKYEFCIDGNVLPYKYSVNRFDFFEGMWQAGKSAYGGDYITATERSEIKYEFQTKGEHKVYYRCMDNLYVWSTWKCETVRIE